VGTLKKTGQIPLKDAKKKGAYEGLSTQKKTSSTAGEILGEKGTHTLKEVQKGRNETEKQKKKHVAAQTIRNSSRGPGLVNKKRVQGIRHVRTERGGNGSWPCGNH